MDSPHPRLWIPLAGLGAGLEVAGLVAAAAVRTTYSVTGSGSCGSGCWSWSIVGTEGHPFLLVAAVLMAAGAVSAVSALLLRRRGRRGRPAAAEST